MGSCNSVAVAAAYNREGSTETVAKVVLHLKRLQLVKRRGKLYILYRVDEEAYFADLAVRSEVHSHGNDDSGRVRERLHEPGAAMVNLRDLPNLYQFPGWSWKDLHNELIKIKSDVQILIYREAKLPLNKLADALQLTFLCLTEDTERDDILRCQQSGFTVMPATRLLGAPLTTRNY
ncbi:hypothetical protein ACP70R_031572 [Stipagrostis hirtigluma subsp. patula]